MKFNYFTILFIFMLYIYIRVYFVGIDFMFSKFLFKLKVKQCFKFYGKGKAHKPFTKAKKFSIDSSFFLFDLKIK